MFAVIAHPMVNFGKKEKNTEKREGKIFFCYSRSHRKTIHRLASFLNLVTPVFLDAKNISPGTKWRDEIDGEIKYCTLFYLFWCKHSSCSDEVRREYKVALHEKKTIIPILLDETGLPAEIEEIQGLTDTIGLCNLSKDEIMANDGAIEKNSQLKIAEIAPKISDRMGSRKIRRFDKYYNERLELEEKQMMPVILRDIDLRRGKDIALAAGSALAVGYATGYAVFGPGTGEAGSGGGGDSGGGG
jgi:hypothetical protein